MLERPFREVDHRADLALEVHGRDLSELLRNAAFGMLELAGAVPKSRRARRRTIRLEAHDEGSLLITWLEELLYSLETRQRTWLEAEIRTEGGRRLTAVVREVPLQSITKNIKAATYHALEIVKEGHGLTTTIVFDV